MMPGTTPQLGGDSTVELLRRLRDLFTQTGYSGSLEDALRSLASGKTGQGILGELLANSGNSASQGGSTSTSSSSSSSHPTPIPI